MWEAEPWYGLDWVAGLARNEGLTISQAREILERGGPNGWPLRIDEATARCTPLATTPYRRGDY